MLIMLNGSPQVLMRGEVARDVDLLHEAVVQDDPVEAVAGVLDLDAASSASTCGTSSTLTVRMITRS